VQTLKHTIMKKKHSSLIERLIHEMQLRNYSPRSVRTYSTLLSKVENYFDLSLDQISIEQFKTFLHHRITTDEVSTSMINQYISAFRILQTDLLGRDWQQIKIKRPRRVKKLPVVLSVHEVEKLIDATRNIKHKTILMLTYSAGLRRQEVLTIKPSAIDSARMQVHVVQGKGKKDRYTILSTKVLEYLRLYYKLEKPTKFLLSPKTEKGNHSQIGP
jgi:integrase/recombinase XerD